MHLLQQKKIECAGYLQFPVANSSSFAAEVFESADKVFVFHEADHKISIELLTRNTDLYEEAKQDGYYRPVSTVAWYNELQSFMKAVVQHEGTIQSHTSADGILRK